MPKYLLICAVLAVAYCSHGAPNPPQVLMDVGITNATNAALFAFDQSTNRVVVTAQTGSEYLAILAHRDSTTKTEHWILSRADFEETNRTVGIPIEIHFVQPPTRRDISRLLKEFVPEAGTNEFTFLKM